MALVIAVGAVGCTGDADPEDPRAVSYIEPVSPTGAVAGRVEDALTGSAIEGATVAILNDAADGRRTATTGADGTFRIDEVEASTSIALTVTKDGHSAATLHVDIPSSAGNLAQDNGLGFAGPVGLFAIAGPDGAKARYRVVDPLGQPLAGAAVSASLDVAFVDDGAPRGRLVGTPRVEGELTLIDGLPDLAALAVAYPGTLLRAVVIPPAGTAFRPVLVERTVAELVAAGDLAVAVGGEPPPPVLDAGPVPVDEDTPLAILDGNVLDLVDPAELGLAPGARPAIPSALAPDATLRLTLSRPVDDTALFLVAASGTSPLVLGGITVTPSLVVGESEITVTPPGGGWPVGAIVDVSVDAVAAGPGAAGVAPLARTGAFLVPPGATYAVASARLVDAGGAVTCPESAAAIEVRLDGPVGHRTDDGTAAIATGDVLPVRATSDAALVPTDNALHPTSDGAPVLATLVAPATGALPSGYSRTLRVPWTAPFSSLDLPTAATTVTFAIALTFNDVAALAETGVGGNGVVRGANGAPMGVVSGPVTLVVTQANGDPCNPL